METEFNQEYLDSLAHKLNNEGLTAEEQVYFNTWYNEHNDHLLELPEGYAANPIIIRDRMHNNMKSYVSQEKAAQGKVTFPLWKCIIAAAAVLLLSLLGYYVYNLFLSHPGSETTMIKPEDIKPGGNKAVLTLANGKRIYLNDIKDGDIASESGTTIKKTNSGELEYTAQQNQPVTNTFNTIETPKGGQYQVRLPDGTKVWLNAASRLSYPVSFLGSDKRVVLLSGEAYFQVAKNKEHPFVVKSNGQEVTVLGTHFNINSYADEDKSVTTLAEGLVRVSAYGKEQLIKPGQQTVKTAEGLTVEKADLTTTLAWKDGLFNFKKADIRSIMPQIARWYDVDVFYSGEVSKELVTGDISRQANLNTVLKILELAHIKFQMEMHNGRKTLIVSQ